MLHVTPIYAGLIALLFIVLTGRVIRCRLASGVSHGDGDREDLLKHIRVQANCAETAPFGLLLLAMAEIQGMPDGLVHVFGATLFLGRVLHAYGFGATPQVTKARSTGMALTLTMLLLVSLANIGLGVS